jgi:mannitol/fructose-specific phosphotransferase system IIA component (Ntr-type)
MAEDTRPVLAELLTTERIVELKATEKDAALKELVALVATVRGQPSQKVILEGMRAREDLMPTGIGEGIAIPHCKDARIGSFGLALGRTAEPLEYGASDGEPVRIIAMISAPADRQTEYLRLLSRVTRFLRQERKRLLEAESIRDVHAALSAY